MSGLDRLKSFWEELKKRNVVRALIFYSVAAWVLIQFAATTFPYLNLPKWAITAVIVTLLVGAPVVAIVSWIYELTNDGLRKTDSVPAETSITSATGKKLNRWIIAVLSIAVIFLLIDKFFLSNGSDFGQQQTESIAIFPFSVQGGADIQYLNEGMVDLISTKLDAIPGMNATDPNILISHLHANNIDYRDPLSAAEVASELGANRVVLGSITAIGDRLQVKISKYSDQGHALGEPIVEEGSISELYSQVDNIIRRLVADELAAEGEDVFSSAIISTSSLEAVIPILKGEQLRRASKFEEAITLFNEAIEADTTFALAYLKFLEAAGWSPSTRQGSGAADWIKKKAKLAELSKNLKGKLRDYIDAQLAYSAGDQRAIDLYKRLIEKYGESRATLSGLAESIYHYRGMAGGNVWEAEPYFERVLEIDPSNQEPLIHLIQLAGYKGNYEKMRELEAKYTSEINPRNYARYNLLFEQDTVTDAELTEIMKNVSNGFHFMSYNGILAPEALALKKRVKQLNDRFHFLNAYNEIEEAFLSGRHEAVLSQWMDGDPQTMLTPVLVFSLNKSGFTNVSPFTARSDEIVELATMVKSLSIQQGKAFDLVEIYQKGLSHLYAGEYDDMQPLLDDARLLFDDHEYFMDVKTSALAKHVYHNLSGIKAFNMGFLDQAILYFDSATTQTAGLPMAYGRLTAKSRHLYQAEYYIQNERYEEALQRLMFTLSFDDSGTYEVMLADKFYWGYTMYRIAFVHEQLGNQQEAIAFYSKFAKAYAKADDTYQPWVDDALARLSSLVGRPEAELRGEIQNEP